MCVTFSLLSRGGRRGDSGSRIGASSSFTSELGGMGGLEEQLDGGGYIMASTTVFLRLIEVRGLPFHRYLL